jgi:hypothetical protein
VRVLRDAGEDDQRAALLRGEPFHERGERPFEDVVCQEDAAAVVAHESLCQAERLGDSAFMLLIGVEKPLDPVLVPVAEQPEELPGVRAAGDEH